MNKKIYMTAICALLMSAVASAQDEGRSSAYPTPHKVTERSELKPHVGLLVGTASPEGGGDIAPEFGIDVGYQPYIPFGLGAEFSHTRIEQNGVTDDRNTVWAKGTYNFGGTTPFVRHTYVGVGIGAVFAPSETSVAGAPIIGFDIPIPTSMEREALSVGASAKYAVVGNNEADALSVNGAVKYWY